MSNSRITRKQRRSESQSTDREESQQNNRPSFKSPSFNLKRVNPITENQRKTFELFDEGKHLLLTGTAGTGKTFLSLYLSLSEMMLPDCEQNKIYIIRSVVPTRDMGFLPGNQKEKMKVYEAPYYGICTELYGRSDAYEILKQKNAVEFMSTSFVRGITMNDCFVIVDEMQNMTASELHSVFTRIGERCRVIFSGDLKQNDLGNGREKSGFADFIKVLNRMPKVGSVEFNRNDIVRSQLLKEYIITREVLEESGSIAKL